MNRVCARCVMDNSDPTITFDSNGYCNYCTDVMERMPKEYLANADGKRYLDKIISKIKRECKDLKYDCMVGVSGGIDSSYIVYLGYQYGLRMLCVHIDDGLDTDVAKNNVIKLCKMADVDLITVTPDISEYKDATLSLFKAGVPNLAIIQDNLLISTLNDTANKYKIKYSLCGGNFATESILQRSLDHVNPCDKKHILSICKRFCTGSVNNLHFCTMFEKYISAKYFSKTKNIYPLNYIEYNLEKVLQELSDFCGYEYYGGKHWESVLTRFLQCYYLPTFFCVDKRKSHFSSMIMSNQMTRSEALLKLASSEYTNDSQREADFKELSNYFCLTYDEFIELINGQKHRHLDYPVSILNKFAPLARKFRKVLG